jgi:hypothetical protein
MIAGRDKFCRTVHEFGGDFGDHGPRAESTFGDPFQGSSVVPTDQIHVERPTFGGSVNLPMEQMHLEWSATSSAFSLHLPLPCGRLLEPLAPFPTWRVPRMSPDY